MMLILLAAQGMTLTNTKPATPVEVRSAQAPSTVVNAVPVVRVVTHNGGFDWGDAGIGAGGMLALTLIGLGGAVTLTHRRGIHDPHTSKVMANLEWPTQITATQFFETVKAMPMAKASWRA